MKYRLVAGAVALAVTAVSGPALADDPNDALLSRSAAARAKDRAVIRQLNINELNHVRARDARYAKDWEAYREQPARQAAYERERAAYEKKMAAWREAVQRCRAGDYRYCDN
jgi:hypothetical protein